MAHEVCHDVSEWVEENVSQPVEQCVEQDCNWWCLCCNKWFCFIVWIVVTIGNWVVHAVCELVADVVDLVVAVVTGLIDVVVGIFTWDWDRVWDGLVKIVGAAVVTAIDIFRIATLGDLVGFISESTNKWQLRDYVRGLIDGNAAYSNETKTQIKNAIGVDGGGFGLRLAVRTMRGFVRSDSIDKKTGVPDLVAWNSGASPELKLLAGYKSTSFWQRGRPEVVGDSGSISEEDIDDYLAKGGVGADVKQFSIFCMDNGTLDLKLSTGVVKAEQLGLKLRFDKEDVQFTRADQARVATGAVAAFFTSPPFNRALETGDPAGAQRDLCSPIAIGTFLFDDNSFTGFSAHLHDCTCLDGTNFGGQGATGAVFRDRLPDIAFRYVPVHELGHTFGLCHVDGLDRIMFSPKQNTWWSWSLLVDYLWLHGEPGFTLDEAKKVWDYIIANFSAACLSRRQF